MDNKKIQAILQEALEEEIPSSDIHLWPAVKSLVAGRQTNQQGVPKMNTPFMRRVPRIAVVVLAIVALFILVLTTPQGQSFAQSLLRFFSPAEDTLFPLSDPQIAIEPENDSPTADAPSPLLSVAEAEAQAGFDAAELSFVPKGFEYLGARLYGNIVSIEYQAIGLGGNLIITQSREGYNEAEWDSVPAEFVVAVKIGALDGEFVQGSFVVFPNATEATWNPDMALWRLRWEKDGVYYEITKFGDVQAIEYLDQAGLVALAEDLMGQ